MASNKKWFKRALRTLVHGEKQLWGLIKDRLTTEQIEHIEKEFSLSETQDTVEPATPETSISAAAKNSDTGSTKKKSETKTKRRTTTTKKRATTRRTKKEK